MNTRRLLTAAVIALCYALIPVERDAEAAFGLGLSTASCAPDDCGHPTFIDCFCPDLYIPNVLPLCDDD